jgi:hypothetical protein
MAKGSVSKRQHAFQFRAGVRITGTVMACDIDGGADLVFVSHARALPVVRGAAARPRGRHPRLQILTTPETLTLMGVRGDRLRARALMPGFGRPFTLGFLRLELIPSRHLPGAASLFCDTGDDRRVLYAPHVPARAGRAEQHTTDVRNCDALCVDATFGETRFRFLAPEDAETRLLEFASGARSARRAAVLFVASLGPAQRAAKVLHGAGWKLRGDRAIVDATALYIRSGIDAPPIARFAGKLASDEILLWSCGDAETPLAVRPRPLESLPERRIAWLSPWAGDATAAARLNVDAPLPSSMDADFEGLLSYILASGAREVATLHGPSEELAAALRARGVAVYGVGPPRQIGLFEASPLG